MSNPRKLKYAVVHGIIKVPDAAQVGPTLSSTATGANKGLTMTLDNGTVKIDIPMATKVVTVYVPESNFSHYQFED